MLDEDLDFRGGWESDATRDADGGRETDGDLDLVPLVMTVVAAEGESPTFDYQVFKLRQ